MKSIDEMPGTMFFAIIAVVTAGVAALAACHPTIAAIIGSAELSVLGVPQLAKNFREPASARDVSLETTLIWFFVAFFLSLVSWIRQSSCWYILLNVSGVIESGALLAQIIAYARPAGALSKSALSALGAVAVGFLALRGMAVTQAIWAYLLFPTAMCLLIIMNVPQILKNYDLYRREGLAPKGITPYYPALVVTGSFLHLIAAMRFGDSFWAFNSFIGVGSASIILGQILLPGATNLILARFAEMCRPWSSKWA
ncbi:MAG: hypothetical protein ACYCPQ_10450 [Elusimicrobiota bacterium]